MLNHCIQVDESIIEIALPKDEDLIVGPPGPAIDQRVLPSPFVACIQMVVICGRIK